MKKPVSYVYGFSLMLAICCSIDVQAGNCSPIPANASEGQLLYCGSCASCHGEVPDSNARKAANDASKLRSAFNSVASMRFLSGAFSNTEINSIVAYIANPTAVVTTSTLSGVASQVTPLVGTNVLLSAYTASRASSSTITFSENGTALSACTSLPVLALPGATTSGVASCRVNAIRAGKHDYTIAHSAGLGGVSEQAILTVNTLGAGPLDYTDMWWAGTIEDGWGLSITQHGNIQFIVIYAYDSAGKPLWYVMPGGSWNAAQTAYTGLVYLPTSAPFSAYSKDQFKINPSVGTATVTYTGTGNATLTYTINGISGSKRIERQLFALDDGQPKLLVNDLWWAGNQEDGWGMNIAQQGRVLFPVWYTYDSSGKAVFFAVPGGTWVGTAFTGDIYSTVSSPWLGVTYNPALFKPTKVGSMTINFSDQASAVMTYTVNGLTQSKNIVRQPY